MADSDNLKQQRDLFLGFSIKPSDLLVEISDGGKIKHISKTAKDFTGKEPDRLKNRSWLEIFSPFEQARIEELRKSVRPGFKKGPFVVEFDKSPTEKKAILSCFKLPDSHTLYTVIGLSDEEASKSVPSIMDADFDDSLYNQNPPGDEEVSDINKPEDLVPEDEIKDIDSPSPLAPEDEIGDIDKPTSLSPEDELGDINKPDGLPPDDEIRDIDKPGAITSEDSSKDIDRPENLAPENEDSDIEKPATMETEEQGDIEHPGTLTPEDEIRDIDKPEALEPEKEFNDSIYNKTEFLDEADKIFEFARTENIDPEITVFDFGRSETIPEENWAEAMGRISELLREESIGGGATAELAEGRYSLVHDSNTDAKAIKEKIAEIIKTQDPEGSDTIVVAHTVSTDTESLDEEDQEKAFFHTINEIAEAENITDIPSLSAGLKTLVTDNDQKVKEFKSYIDRVSFSFHYQPVANLNDHELNHYEMLCRFDDGDTRQWIKFGEDTGLSPGLDLAVCERVGNHLTYKVGGTRTIYSMNISPVSALNPSFAEKFFELLAKYKNLNERLIIEFTNARKIVPSTELKNFISILRSEGYKITLDNLGADAQSIWLLDELETDFVKLDGAYTDKILKSDKTRSLVKNLVKKCREKGIGLSGKTIETAEQAEALKAFSIESGQGFYFGHPQSKPSYQPPK